MDVMVVGNNMLSHIFNQSLKILRRTTSTLLEMEYAKIPHTMDRFQ